MVPSGRKRLRAQTKLAASLVGIVAFYLLFWLWTVNHHVKNYEDARKQKQKMAYRDFVQQSKNDYSRIIEQQNRLHPLPGGVRPHRQEHREHRMEFMKETHK